MSKIHPHAERLEKVGADPHASERFDLATADRSDAEIAEDRQMLEGAGPPLPVADRRIADGLSVRRAAVELDHADETRGVAIRKRRQQDGLDDGEDDRGGSDADRKGRDRDRRKGRTPSESTDGEAEVASQPREPRQSALIAQRVHGLRGAAGGEAVRRGVFQVDAELVLEISIAAPGPDGAAQPGGELAQRHFISHPNGV